MASGVFFDKNIAVDVISLLKICPKLIMINVQMHRYWGNISA